MKEEEIQIEEFVEMFPLRWGFIENWSPAIFV